MEVICNVGHYWTLHIWILLLKPKNLGFCHFSYNPCASSSTLSFRSVPRAVPGQRVGEQETGPAPISFLFLARTALQ